MLHLTMYSGSSLEDGSILGRRSGLVHELGARRANHVPVILEQAEVRRVA